MAIGRATIAIAMGAITRAAAEVVDVAEAGVEAAEAVLFLRTIRV